MSTVEELAGEPLDCYYIHGTHNDYYGVVFPEPNGRAALWSDDGVGGVTIHDSFSSALESAESEDFTPASPYHTRPFILRRYEDVSGRSGTGTPAVGVEFPDKTCAMGWLTDVNSVSVYDALNEVQDIHGHGGKTRVFYADEAEA